MSHRSLVFYKLEGNTHGDYTKLVPPSMTPKKKILYQDIVLLNTRLPNANRLTFAITYVSSIKNLISINLRREVLEGSMKDAPTTMAGDNLTSLNGVFEDLNAAAGFNLQWIKNWTVGTWS